MITTGSACVTSCANVENLVNFTYWLTQSQHETNLYHRSKLAELESLESKELDHLRTMSRFDEVQVTPGVPGLLAAGQLGRLHGKRAHRRRAIPQCIAVGIALTFVTSCATKPGADSERVTTVLQRRSTAAFAQPPTGQSSYSATTPSQSLPPVSNLLSMNNSASPGNSSGDVIATVDGHAIMRNQFVGLLLRGHGPGLLEQLAVYERARALAVKRGLRLSPTDVEQEYERSLSRLIDPLSAVAIHAVDLSEGEELLAEILSQRNISRQEFDVSIRRNALLRKLVNADQHFTEAQIEREYDTMMERKAEVRHIQVATRSELGRVLARLDAGEDFADVARRYSANTTSAKRGGLLLPFSEHDAQIPSVLRKTAFALHQGGVSHPIRLGAWYHILNLERFIPADSAPLELVRDKVESRLRDRLAETAMRLLYEKLLREAQIEINDPILREAFELSRVKASP